MQDVHLTRARPAAAAVHQAARRLRARAMLAWLLNVRAAMQRMRPSPVAGGTLAMLSKRELADIGVTRDHFAVRRIVPGVAP